MIAKQITFRKVLFLFLFFLVGKSVLAQTEIVYDIKSKAIAFGAAHIRDALSGKDFKEQSHLGNPLRIIIQVVSPSTRPDLLKEGYELGPLGKRDFYITATDSIGAMYGALDVAEQLKTVSGWPALRVGKRAPYLPVRAIKFDLPWSSYRTGMVMEQHTEVCRDLHFWEAFLDMMAENRFNTLSLWNVHPFPFMVKTKHFPYANDFSAQEMAAWKSFWTNLFRMARERGIEPYIVNWNIAVSPEFAQHYHVQERNDTSAIVKQYMKESVTQVINEYPDLAGIGVTLADWMSNFKSEGYVQPNMTPKDREKWIEETVIAGIKAADRPVKLLHRSVLSADPQELRSTINRANLPDTVMVEVKFNMSHAYSTPDLLMTHDVQSGKTNDGYWNPLPDNYRIQWTVRNEDFFILNWGHPDFIRQHILQNTQPYVNGYFVGSEGYIPAKDVAHKPGAYRSWEYAFQKQWLFYQLWGRLLYDPQTPNQVFERAFDKRYGKQTGKPLLEAYTKASEMPLMLASFYASSWDYTLYSEGFLAPFADGKHDDVSSFISIDELIDHRTLDPHYLSIKDFVEQEKQGKRSLDKISPLKLADSLDNNVADIHRQLARLDRKVSDAMQSELDDIKAWTLLSTYFASKLRAGVALCRYRTDHNKQDQQQAIAYLQDGLGHWKQLSEITARHYQEVPYLDDHSSGGKAVEDARRFSWKKYLPQVERDIALARQ